MNYDGPNFTRPQITLFVQINIASAVDILTSARPGRYMDGLRDDAWREECRSSGIDKHQAHDAFEQAMSQLGWNLSILWATLNNDGMGTSDALEYANLQEELFGWASDWIAGKRGIIPNPNGPAGSGTYDLPETKNLAEKWVAETFEFPGDKD